MQWEQRTAQNADRRMVHKLASRLREGSPNQKYYLDHIRMVRYRMRLRRGYGAPEA